jgi:AcrR family transcriptional regulator
MRPMSRTIIAAALPAREALLDAGVVVAERHGLAGLSVARVVAEAGLGRGAFYVHFRDRSAFVDALHERFYAHVGDAVAAATEAVPPGRERLVRGIRAYLDACLADRAVKALLLEARAQGGLSGASREELFASLSSSSFKAMGWSDVRVAARLFVRLASEAAILELEAGKRLPAVRRTLVRFLGRGAT